MNYQQKLLKIIKATGWTQDNLARQLDVSFATLNAWLNKRSAPRKDAIQKIDLLFLDILGVEQIDFKKLALAKKAVGKLACSVNKLTADEQSMNNLMLYLTYNSNTIEGSTMTLADTRAVLFNYKTLINRSQIEQIEALNHQAALVWVLGEMQKDRFAITEQFVKDVHLRLMNGLINSAGQYRNHNVRIMGSKIAVFNHLKISEKMPMLIMSINQKSADLVAKLAQTHAEFEQIHPFSDGNGRVGRLLMLAIALSASKMPPIVLKERKNAYYKYLEAAQTKQNYAALELFIAEAMIHTGRLLFSQKQK